MTQPITKTLFFVAIVTFLNGKQAFADKPVQQSNKPNIIFFLADDMRWDMMGCAGNKIIQTPHLDRLADQGTLFANSFVTTSICAVSRASFLTGQFASRHNVRNFSTPLSPSAFAKTFPAILRSHGYRTGFVGKWGLGGQLPKDQFDFWAGYSGQGRYFAKDDPEHLTAKLCKKALQFVQESPSNKPFLLWVSFKAPHAQDWAATPFPPDPKYNQLYKNITIPLAKTANQQAFESLPEFIRRSEGRLRWHKRFVKVDAQESLKNYYRLVTGIDNTVGQVSAEIEKRGLTDNTVVIFSSDNGFFLGEHGLTGKWLMYEESIRVPLVIYHPSTKPSGGKRISQMALNIDIAPTIIDLAGLDIPDKMQGSSLKPLLLGQDTRWRNEWFYEHHFEYKDLIPRNEGVRTERWKYTRYLDSQPLYEELFDLQNDPAEEHNLAYQEKHASLLDDLRQRWRALRNRAR